MKSLLRLALLVAFVFPLASQAHAGILGAPVNDPTNDGPPSGNIILNLDGQSISSSYQLYTVTFMATSTSTNLSFAFRDDPAFLFLSNVSVTDTTTPNGNIVSNGNFSGSGSAPTDWSYLNTFGASFGGTVDAGAGAVGGNAYKDGAVQAYDGITQTITTKGGDTYSVSFYLAEDSGFSTYSQLSTNGNVSDTGGNGIDLVVYAGGVPSASPTPEPASIVMAVTGALVASGYGWRRKRKGAPVSA